MNIVMRNNDIIHVPSLDMGEFYIMGEVSRPGVYSLTGRQITMKMAVAAAGNLNGLAWPENSLLIRRIGGNQEQFIPLNLESIFKGEDPDLFLKPNDVIAVGTEVRASFFAVIRNAFRLTYGFGFIYDRNFSDPRSPDATPTSTRFTRW
jgi:protein involved in polysaccharide export with SLBB domain